MRMLAALAVWFAVVWFVTARVAAQMEGAGGGVAAGESQTWPCRSVTECGPVVITRDPTPTVVSDGMMRSECERFGDEALRQLREAVKP